MKLLLRKIVAYIIDYGVVFIFSELYFFCANVFFLDVSTRTQGYLMLICAFITLLILTSYIPTHLQGQTIGQKIMKLKVVNQNGKPRTYFQSFIRECVVKITCAPLFIPFTFLYFTINSIIKRDTNIELPHDFVLKTELQSIV